MLRGPDGAPFTSFSAPFRTINEGADTTSKIWVEFKAANFPGVYLAMLDTGAAYSVFANELALKWQLDQRHGVETRIRSKAGLHKGKLVQVDLVLPSDDGAEMTVPSTVFYSEDWGNQPNILGFGGFLEHFNFAVESGQHSERWHFGKR